MNEEGVQAACRYSSTTSLEIKAVLNRYCIQDLASELYFSLAWLIDEIQMDYEV